MSFASGQINRDAALIKRFGGVYSYTELGEGPRDVHALFEKPTGLSNAGPRPVSATFPMIYVLKSEIPNLRRGDQFEIDGVTYECKQPSPDEGEIVSAKLEEFE